MYCYLDSRCKVFVTSKTLDERFTPYSPSCFIVNNGYTSRHNSNYVTERKEFENRSGIVIDKRISQYEGGNFKQIERKIFGNENKNIKFQEQLNRYDYMFRKNSYVNGRSGPAQRTWGGHFKNKNVIRKDYYLRDSNGRELIPYIPNFYRNNTKLSSCKWKLPPPTKKELDDELDRYMAERKIKQTPVTPINDDFDLFITKSRLEIEDYYLKDSNDREPITYKPNSSRNDTTLSSCKWKWPPPTKEELDDELDRYMAERKIKQTPVTPINDDVDLFITKSRLGIEDYYLADYNGREPITYKPNSSRNDTKLSSCKWKWPPPTKEELDDEIDSYMAEIKIKQTPVTPINDDVDLHIRKFRLEIENYLSKNSYVYGHGPVKRTLDGRFKNKNVKVSKDREPIIYKPDSNKAKRAKLSKELDEEMDRYMAERKIKRDNIMSY